MSTLDQKLNSILSESLRPTLEKVSSVNTATEAPLSLSNSEAQGLAKVAAVLRSSNVEPTYSDLYSFIGGLYGNR